MRGFGRSRGKPALSAANVDVAEAESPQAQAEAIAELSYELEEYAEDLAGLLDRLELPLVYLNAHSMGASIATFFLNRYTERVQQAILTCNGIFEYDAKAFAAFHKFGTYVVKFRYDWFLKFPFADRMFMARFLHRPINKSDRLAF